MKTFVNVHRGSAVIAVWEGDLPVISEGQLLRTMTFEACRVFRSFIDLATDPPTQTVVAR